MKLEKYLGLGLRIFCLLVLFFEYSKCGYREQQKQQQGEEVSKWASEIGKQLWNLGKTITRSSEIEKKYKFHNAQVEKKDPRKLLEEIKTNILAMMDRKMDAIRCIQQKAEEVAENFEYNSSVPFTYFSSKYSSVGNETKFLPAESLRRNQHMYKPMMLNNDTHFYNLAVNTSYSSVHVPTNVYDLENAAAEAIQWSEALDEVFVQNYKSDPALFWQYFGSSSGVMRHYPAKQWEEQKKIKYLYDCRIRTWYIEAATCTKDVIILVDNSGSMDGMGKHIASLTAYNILDTFSNNDFVNVLNYSDSTNYTVPCFENMLVQATRENIKIFKDAIDRLEPSGKTDLEQAIVIAFELLQSYRTVRGCDGNSTSCNQAIMILTDGVNANYSEIVLKYNHLYNGAKIPVRIFTYLIGQEVSTDGEISWLACANRGYHTHVQTLEQVQVSVLQYINVIARPLVLQDEHPVSWTHAYADLTYDDANDNIINEPYRLLTSAAIPCFDRKINKMNNTRTATLLGVAGTDVPIDEFRKLALPYKIGVNAYAAIVSNNGYVLMHPDLRPVFEGQLKENYNSIDFTEVEQLAEDLPPRTISDQLYKLRDALINGEDGSMFNVTLKYHYDDNRRVAEETYDYYYSSLTGTPFSIAIVIPSRYGHFALEVGNEIQRNRHTGQNLTSFFKGKWKVHPKWVYCKYHYLEGHEFNTSEEEIFHFLGNMYDLGFKWEKQYDKNEIDLDTVECGRKTLGDDNYYCDEQLVQRLIFDARNTLEPFKEKWIFQSAAEKFLFDKYNASVRFVATMSGLTRWDYISDSHIPKGKKEFGDYHPRAIDEKWYKAAVFQHKFDKESFVYSVPFDASLANDNDDVLVTGSFAIFPSDKGIEAPGSVVGFQFPLKNLRVRFAEVASKLSNQCPRCDKCGENLDCYIVDSNGYVIVSNETTDSGRFIGEIEGDVFQSMLEDGVYKKKILYDYQALCRWDDEEDSSGSIGLLNPLNYVIMTVNWIVIRIMQLIIEINLFPLFTLAQDVMENIVNSTFDFTISDGSESEFGNNTEPEEPRDMEEEEEDDDVDNLYFECEKEINLFVLNQDMLKNDRQYSGDVVKSVERTYYVKRIPNSNLIFLAIEKGNVEDLNKEKPVFTTNPKKISKAPNWDNIIYINLTLLPCQKLYLNRLPRRRLTGCYNEHPLEHEIKECGRAAHIELNYILLLIAIWSKFYLL